MVERKRRSISGSCRSLRILRIADRWLGRKHLRDPFPRGSRSVEDDCEIRDIGNGDQDLRHVVHEGNDLALLEEACLYLEAACPEHADNAEVHEEIGARVQERSKLSDGDGSICLGDGSLAEALLLFLLMPEGTDDTDARERLACHERDMVELLLHEGVVRNRALHHKIEDQGDERCHGEEDEAERAVDHDGSGKRADSQDRPADELPYCHGRRQLYLVHIVRDPRHERRSADAVDLGSAKAVDLPEERIPHVRADTLRDLRCDMLRHECR